MYLSTFWQEIKGNFWKEHKTMDNKGVVEKRRHKRFRSKDFAYAAFRSQSMKIGQIVDISKGGLAFHYIADGDQINGARELEIYLATNGFHMKDIPFNTVSDFVLPSEFPLSTIIMRRRGVQFGELSKFQETQLGYLLENHTVGEV
jgi:hypothetical protein